MIATESRPGPADVIVVGGGLAGLTAACSLARAGVAVTLFEKAAELGGRAATRERGGFRFNRGLHALYTGGAASAILRDLGITYGYGTPPGTFALRDGKLSPVPASAGALLRSDLLGFRDKLALARLFAALPRFDPRALARVSVRAWIAGASPRPAVRRLLASIARPFVYSAALDLVSAEVLVGKLQTVLAHPVHYLDGGWQTLVDALRRAAERAGAQVVVGARVEAVAHRDGRIRGVRLGRGDVLPAAAVVVATTAREAAKLLAADAAPALHRAVADALPARVACLDVALRRLPDARHTVVQDLEGPRFLSAQSRYARIAPAGAALIGAFKQLDPRRPADPRADERDLEGLLDAAQPGWRDLVVERAYLPRIEAVGLLPTAAGGGLVGRPGPRVAGLAGLYLAGDWIGPEGFLADASFASAREAARLALAPDAPATRERSLAGAAR
jgi:phytoene dehydrogenase-like protein